jgi:hypothetical protein
MAVPSMESLDSVSCTELGVCAGQVGFAGCFEELITWPVKYSLPLRAPHAWACCLPCRQSPIQVTVCGHQDLPVSQGSTAVSQGAL